MILTAEHSHFSIRKLLPLLLLLLALTPSAFAEQAKDVTPECTISATENATRRKYILTDDYRQRWDAGEKGLLEVKLPGKQTCQGIMVTHYGQETALEVLDDAGRRIGYGAGAYRIEWIPFEREVNAFTVRRERPSDPLIISRLNVLTPGKLPDWVQRWETLKDPAELLLIVTHPDDEILWFGGLLPYYAGELGRKVMVAYLVGGLDPLRTLELLNGLWHLGVKTYPDIGTLPNTGKNGIGSVYLNWGHDAAKERVVSVIRRYKPQVVITQDVNGEYGHSTHIVMTQGIIEAVEGLSADPKYHPESAKAWGTWTPLKLYIHLWKENQIIFDWRQPLSAFNGKTGLRIAKEAFKMHKSQQNDKHSVEDKGVYDCSRFGLYWSSVGPDKKHKDLFEHVPPRE